MKTRHVANRPRTCGMVVAVVLAWLWGATASQAQGTRNNVQAARAAAAGADPTAAPEGLEPAGEGTIPAEPADESRGRPMLMQGEGEEAPAEEEGEDEEGEPVIYDPQGRRDPFRPLVGQVQVAPGNCDDRLECLLIGDLKLTAILKGPDQVMAMLEGGPKRQGYFARDNDRFRNGFVFRIDYENRIVIVREELNDPRLLKPWRDWVLALDPRADSTAAGKRQG